MSCLIFQLFQQSLAPLFTGRDVKIPGEERDGSRTSENQRGETVCRAKILSHLNVLDKPESVIVFKSIKFYFVSTEFE